MDATGGTFTLTFGFQNAADLELANAGSITALGWLADADPALGIEAQYGLSLDEFIEFGGPGMAAARRARSGPAVAAWRPTAPWAPERAASPSTGTTPSRRRALPGDRVHLPAASADGAYEVGKRLPNTAATEEITTLNGLVAGEVYSIDIVAKSAAGEGTRSVISRVKAATHLVPTATATTLRKPTPTVSTRRL